MTAIRIGNPYRNLNRWKKILLGVNHLFLLLLLCSYLALYIPPAATTFFSIVALGFPVYLVINFIFFLFWLIQRKKHFLLPLVFLIGGYYHISRTIQFTILDQVPKESKLDLSVMSYNVRLFDLYNWTENKSTRNGILDFLSNENPDIICFQEYFYSSGNHFDTRDTLLTLIDAKYYSEHFTKVVKEPAYQGGESHFGSAIFSKYPIINQGLIPFENDPSNHGAFVDIVKKEDTIRIYNAHLGSIRFQKADYDIIGGKGTPGGNKSGANQNILGRLQQAYQKRTAQAKTILDHSASSPYPVIICVDMNDTPISYTYGQFDKYLSDAFTESGNGFGATYIGNYPFLRIDYIWSSDELSSSNFTTHQIELSDHKPISCDVHLIP